MAAQDTKVAKVSNRKLQKRIKKLEAEECKYNQIKTPTNVLFNIILAVLSLICVVPFIFVIIISFTDEASLAMNGYRFIPEKLSFYAYEYIVSAGENILKSYGVTIFITIVGTIIGLLLTGTYAYALSRKTYAFRKFFTTVITIPMLFSGGMIANYLIVTKVLMLKDSLWAQDEYSGCGRGIGEDRRSVGVEAVLPDRHSYGAAGACDYRTVPDAWLLERLVQCHDVYG